MFRKPQNKQKAKKQFKNNVRRTKAINVAPPPLRGGYRL